MKGPLTEEEQKAIVEQMVSRRSKSKIEQPKTNGLAINHILKKKCQNWQNTGRNEKYLADQVKKFNTVMDATYKLSKTSYVG